MLIADLADHLCVLLNPDHGRQRIWCARLGAHVRMCNVHMYLELGTWRMYLRLPVGTRLLRRRFVETELVPLIGVRCTRGLVATYHLMACC